MDVTTIRRSTRAREIALAALQLFARKGYAAASIEEISTEAGIGKSTVYEYYRNKKELFLAAVTEGAEQWFSDLDAIGRETDDPIERLQRIAALYIQGHGPEQTDLKSKLFYEVVSQALLENGAFFDRPHLILSLYQRQIRTIVNVLLEGVSSGRLRPEIASYSERIAINFMAWLDGLVIHNRVAGDQIDLRAQIDLVLTQAAPLMGKN
ncbi:TetR/AcrR family transcriptional regulator [Desulfatitalea tepidiphila]|uniref:TetR/AcrR family transcriptional regulator n=1 Tax=Desulfatitalea tepidiphila TaxID=1185843 RepID=UPI0006B681FA|nr:TetR/AcrR family transcriptional regulator [Desulfatitalea tepidiphila]